MTITLADLLSPSDRDDMLAEILSIAAMLEAPTTSWIEGDPILTLLTTASQKLADLTQVAVEITKGGFGDLLPSDGWADIWAQSRFNVQRVAASPALGKINITNASATSYGPIAVGGLIVAHSTTGKTYRNSAPVTIPASGSIDDVDIAADEPGTASNAAPSAITTVVSSLVGVSVTNPAAVLGTDQETTPALVVRARAKLGALSPNGARDAYNYVATTPELSATSSPITRTRTVADPSTGEVTVYIADAAGSPSSGDVAIVQAAISQYAEPWGTTATAVAASPVSIDVTYQVWISGSQLTTAQIETAIADALTEYLADLPLGGFVIPPDTGAIYVTALQQVIGTSTPGILRVAITVPSGDTVMTPDQVAQIGAVVPTITVVS